MSAPRRRRNFEQDSEGEPNLKDRWMASYMDMVTVLFCLFIVLFAISVVNEGKYNQLRQSLAAGFHITTAGEPNALPMEKPLTDAELAKRDVDEFTTLQNQIRANLAKLGLNDAVQFAIDGRGLTVRFVGAETFFQTGKASLTQEADHVLDAVSAPLIASAHRISVEGHADYRAATYPYPSNWELSSDRAIRVLRHLVEDDGLPADHISAVGFGSTKPIATATDNGSLAANRRVDVVVLSDQPERIRQLIPQIVDANRPPALSLQPRE